MKYLEDPDLTLFQGDVSEVLRSLDAESVHCVVTSPPYWGLRDYGTGVWEGGNPDCDHAEPPRGGRNPETAGKQLTNAGTLAYQYGATCGKCGARRVDNQLGLEPTPDLYLESMVAVFREVRRVLRPDGTCWLNIGDCYASQGDRVHGGFNGSTPTPQRVKGEKLGAPMNLQGSGIKTKDLCMIPARLALALQADGWWLRSQIVWSKPNPMPESVTDRPTSSYELVYLLAKSPRYFFDAEAVREPHQYDGRKKLVHDHAVNGSHDNYANMGTDQERWPNSGRNVRNVWEIATQPYPEAHFATYPEELVRRCVLAGTSERGCCPECGAPWTREIERGELVGTDRGGNYNGRDVDAGVRVNPGTPGLAYQNLTTGWLPSCGRTDHNKPPVPCTVLDPFFGSGTTGLVARKHGRRTIGIELSSDYCALAARRLSQLSLLSEVNHVV